MQMRIAALVLAGAAALFGQAPAGARPADQPVARTDQNSLTARQDLLNKRDQAIYGEYQIDVYFQGDSILRRWGATDYPELLAHWNESFHGWNAADFAWGGDTTQNILWRLGDGGGESELAGIYPEVIVLHAGTNNIGNRDPGGEAAIRAKANDVTQGLYRIIEVMHQQAPDAAMIVTAIFPRNDNLAVMPVINQVNANLERIVRQRRADGEEIRFLNINSRLADENGVLYPGMMGDNLHPALPGYQIWAEALQELLTEALGPPATEDHAPPATGNPAAEGR